MASGQPSARDASIEHLERFLPYRLSLLAHHLSLSSADLVFGRHTLTVQEWKVLSIVADLGPLTPYEIRRHGTQEKSTISWALKRLHERGFVKRSRNHADGRTFTVQLSQRGWACYRSLIPKARHRAQCLLAVLTKKEIAALDRIVDKLDGPTLGQT